MSQGKVLNLGDLIVPDTLARSIANQYSTWNSLRGNRIAGWKEVRDYVYAVDTSTTANATLPWSNKVTIPKLCQIRDNLLANYEESLFPRKKWLVWTGATEDDEKKEKKKVIEAYANYIISQREVRNQFTRLLMDYIDTGNCFVGCEWINGTIERPGETEEDQIGYTGPMPVRISPYNIVFDPTATDITKTPKIVRSLVTLGEVKKMMSKSNNAEDQAYYDSLFDYMLNIRAEVGRASGVAEEEDNFFQNDGFGSMRNYLNQEYVEVLTFYGDMFDVENRELMENYIIRIVDRHKILDKRPHPSHFSHTPIYQAGWRVKSENLWAMGPLENILGLQYRIDHIENAKDDLVDMTKVPPIKIKGDVDDFEWGPMSRIYLGDDGEVELLQADAKVLETNQEINVYMDIMELMAGAPKEAMGFRTPGEKTAFEIQKQENAAARIFQHKIKQFERNVIEPWLNAAIEMARRNMDHTSIRMFDDEFKIAEWLKLTPEDLTAVGRIRPLAAQHFAEKAQRVQDLNNFFSSAIGADPAVKVHFSGIKLARMFEEMLDLQDFGIVDEFIQLTEQANAERMMNANQEEVLLEQQTAPGLSEEELGPLGEF